MSRSKSRSGSRTPVFRHRSAAKRSGGVPSTELEQLKHEALQLEQDHLALVNALKKTATSDELKDTVQQLKAELRRKDRQLKEETARANQLAEVLKGCTQPDKENREPSNQLEEAKADMKVLYREIKHLNESLQYYKHRVEVLETCWTHESLEGSNGLSAVKELELRKQLDELTSANRELSIELRQKEQESADTAHKLRELQDKHQEALVCVDFRRHKDLVQCETLIAAVSDQLFEALSSIQRSLGHCEDELNGLFGTLNEVQSSFEVSVRRKVQTLQHLTEENALLRQTVDALQTEAEQFRSATDVFAETQTNAWQQEVCQLQYKLTELTQTLDQAKEEAAKRKEELNLVKGQKTSLQATVQTCQEEKENALKNTEALAQELEEAAAFNLRLQKDHATTKEELKEVNFKYEKSIEQVLLSSDQVQTLNQQVSRLEAALDTCKSQQDMDKLQQEALVQTLTQQVRELQPPARSSGTVQKGDTINIEGRLSDCQQCRLLQNELDCRQQERKKAVQILQTYEANQTALQHSECENRTLKHNLAELQDDKKSLTKEVAALRRDKTKLREELRQARTHEDFAERFSVSSRVSIDSKTRDDLTEKLLQVQTEFNNYKAIATARQQQLEDELLSASEEVDFLKHQMIELKCAKSTQEECTATYQEHLARLDTQVAELEQEKTELQAQLDAELSKEVKRVLDKNAADTELLQMKQRETELLAQVQTLTQAVSAVELEYAETKVRLVNELNEKDQVLHALKKSSP